jgi:hypothetical protein
METPDFFPLVSHVWSQWVDGSPVYIWEKKLKRTKHAIKDWVRNSPSSPRKKLRNVKSNLEELQRSMETKEINENSISQEK